MGKEKAEEGQNPREEAKKECESVKVLTDCENISPQAVLVIWGGLELEQDNRKIEFHSIVDPNKQILKNLEFGILDGEEIHPPVDNHGKFYIHLFENYPSDQSYKYGELLEEIEQVFKKFLAAPDNLDIFNSALTNGKKNKFFQIFEKIPLFTLESAETGWLRGLADSPGNLESDIKSTSAEQAEKEDEEEIRTIDLDSLHWEELPEVETLPRVSIATSVAGGVVPDKVEVGDKVKIRLIGETVDRLPEDKKDSRRGGKVSVPLEGEILKIVKEPELPPDIDGEAADYTLFVVKISEEFYGRSYLQKAERLILVDRQVENNRSSDLNFKKMFGDFFNFCLQCLGF